MSRSLTVPLLKKYAYNKYFLETGTYTGGGVQVAAYAGFEHIISIELDETYYNASSRLFKKAIKRGHVTLFHGDSGEELGKVLKAIVEKAVIFLDAHSMEYTPILKELNAIKKSGFTDHTIMIDDKRSFVEKTWPKITVDLLLERLLDINPDYNIIYEDSVNAKKDIIVAIP